LHLIQRYGEGEKLNYSVLEMLYAADAAQTKKSMIFFVEKLGIPDNYGRMDFIYLFKNFGEHTRYEIKAKTRNRLELHGNHRT